MVSGNPGILVDVLEESVCSAATGVLWTHLVTQVETVLWPRLRPVVARELLLLLLLVQERVHVPVQSQQLVLHHLQHTLQVVRHLRTHLLQTLVTEHQVE